MLPVKLTASNFSFIVNKFPVFPSPGNIFKTPFGNISLTISPKWIHVKDEYSLGFKTQVFPNAKAGAIFQTAYIKG